MLAAMGFGAVGGVVAALPALRLRGLYLALTTTRGNVRLAARSTGLPKDSVAKVALVAAIDRSLLQKRVGHLGRSLLERIFSGLDLALGR